jgi:signal recognition particle receptor subunit beta
MNSEETLELTAFDMVIVVNKKDLNPQPEPMEIEENIDHSEILFKHLKIENLNFVLKEDFDLVNFKDCEINFENWKKTSTDKPPRKGIQSF